MVEYCQERGIGTLNTVSLTGPLQMFLSVALPGTLMKCNGRRDTQELYCGHVGVGEFRE